MLRRDIRKRLYLIAANSYQIVRFTLNRTLQFANGFIFWSF